MVGTKCGQLGILTGMPQIRLETLSTVEIKREIFPISLLGVVRTEQSKKYSHWTKPEIRLVKKSNVGKVELLNPRTTEEVTPA